MKPSPRILFVSPCADIGGAEMSLLVLLSGLDRGRYQPVVVVPQGGSFTERVTSLGIETIRFEIHPLMIERQIGRSVRNGVQALRQVPALTRLIQDVRPALVHINSYRIGIPFTVAARREGVPTIWHLRDIPESASKRRLVAATLMLPTRAVAISRAVEHALGLDGRSNVRLIYNGVEIERFTQRKSPGTFRRELGLDEETILMCTIGQLIPWKGQDLLLRAFARLPQKKELHLAVVGGSVAPLWADADENADYLRSLQRLVDDLGIRDRVTFTGFRSDIPAIMGDSDLYVHAARSPEPFGRVLVEAMAAQRVVIAPDWGGIPEIVVDGETGHLFAPNDVDDLAKTLSTALSQQADWPAMGERGLARACANFTAERYVAEMTQLFDEVAA